MPSMVIEPPGQHTAFQPPNLPPCKNSVDRWWWWWFWWWWSNFIEVSFLQISVSFDCRLQFKIDLTSDGDVESNPGPQSDPNSDPIGTILSLSSLGTEPAHKKKSVLSESPLQFLEAEELYLFLDIESLSAKELHTVKLPKTSEKKDAADDELDSEAKPISELSEEPDQLKPDFENDSIIQIGIQLVNTFEHPLQESRSFLLTSKPVLTDDLNAEVLHFENEKEMLVQFIHLLKLENQNSFVVTI
ncbi:hypothetical protein GEMRC1_010873 [Eukaryota sp. GEM-RC1]